MPEEKLAGESSIVEFSDKKGADLPTIVVWVAFAAVVIFAIYFGISKIGMNSLISDKQAELDTLSAQLASPEFAQAESKIQSIQTAVDTLSLVSSRRISKKTVLDDIYKHLTNDVKISSIAVGSDGSVSIDGATASYRSVGDLMIALKSYSRVSELTLNNVSVSTNQDVPDKEKVVFSLSGKIDLVEPEPTATPTASPAPVSESMSPFPSS